MSDEMMKMTPLSVRYAWVWSTATGEICMQEYRKSPLCTSRVLRRRRSVVMVDEVEMSSGSPLALPPGWKVLAAWLEAVFFFFHSRRRKKEGR
jgi:hypothetical protein